MDSNKLKYNRYIHCPLLTLTGVITFLYNYILNIFLSIKCLQWSSNGMVEKCFQSISVWYNPEYTPIKRFNGCVCASNMNTYDYGKKMKKKNQQEWINHKNEHLAVPFCVGKAVIINQLSRNYRNFYYLYYVSCVFLNNFFCFGFSPYLYIPPNVFMR